MALNEIKNLPRSQTLHICSRHCFTAYGTCLAIYPGHIATIVAAHYLFGKTVQYQLVVTLFFCLLTFCISSRAAAASQPEASSEVPNETAVLDETAPQHEKPEEKAADAPPTATDAKVGVLPPLDAMITSPFGTRRTPGWLSRRGMVTRQHNGLDIRAKVGWPVVAFRGGTVIRTGNAGAAGLIVDILQDDAMTARYAHLSKVLVHKGQKIRGSEPVGLVGCTGRTTGAHLHFSLRNANGNYIDPHPLLHTVQQVLQPTPEQIGNPLEAQSCGPIMRGSNGFPRRSRHALSRIDIFTPPSIPAWKDRP